MYTVLGLFALLFEPNADNELRPSLVSILNAWGAGGGRVLLSPLLESDIKSPGMTDSRSGPSMFEAEPSLPGPEPKPLVELKWWGWRLSPLELTPTLPRERPPLCDMADLSADKENEEEEEEDTDSGKSCEEDEEDRSL